MYYQESDNRVRVIAPTVLYEMTTDADLTIKVDCIFNSISGATPTGAPLQTSVQSSGAGIGVSSLSGASQFFEPDSGASPVAEDSTSGASPGGGGGNGEVEDEREGEREDGDHRARYTGASPVSAPETGTVDTGLPMTEVSETRVGLSLEFAKRLGSHTPAVQLSYSTEKDYESMGIALRDSIDFNQKNTTLLTGVAYTYDTIKIPSLFTLDGVSGASPTKQTVEAMLGVTQVLGQRTLMTLNGTVSRADGFMSDPYKVALIDELLVPEKRPDSRDKRIVYVSLLRFIEMLKAGIEFNYRWYTDTFGIAANTFGLEWHQKLGEHFVLRPSVRLYDQSEADFYAERFAGYHEFYSADYRLSSLQALSYGLKGIWTAKDLFSIDLAVERYNQRGKDGVTPDIVYPDAMVFTAGVRIWF